MNNYHYYKHLFFGGNNLCKSCRLYNKCKCSANSSCCKNCDNCSKKIEETFYVTLHKDPFSSPYYKFRTENKKNIKKLTLEKNKIYKFVSENKSHPFNIGTKWNQSSTSEKTGGIQLKKDKSNVLTIKVVEDNLIYYCSLHSVMQNKIIISN